MTKVEQLEQKLQQDKYKEQVFLDGTKVTIDSRLYAELLKLHADTAKLLNHLQAVNGTFNKQLVANSQAIGALQERLDILTEPIMESYIDAVDSGLTKNRDNGSNIDNTQQQG